MWHGVGWLLETLGSMKRAMTHTLYWSLTQRKKIVSGCWTFPKHVFVLLSLLATSYFGHRTLPHVTKYWGPVLFLAAKVFTFDGDSWFCYSRSNIHAWSTTGYNGLVLKYRRRCCSLACLGFLVLPSFPTSAIGNSRVSIFVATASSPFPPSSTSSAPAF